MICRIHWRERCVAGNPRINWGEDDNWLIWCSGWTRMDQPDRTTAMEVFQNCFPKAEIIDVE